MSPEIILAAIVAIPSVLLPLLRVNAALVFLSLCLGAVLVQFISPDANDFLALFTRNNFSTFSTGSNSIKLALLLVPPALTTIFMIRTVRGKSRLLLNILPSVGVGLLGALLVVPLLSPGLSHNIVNSSLWVQVQRSQDLIVGGSAMVCLFVLWMQRPKSGGESKRHHKHA